MHGNSVVTAYSGDWVGDIDYIVYGQTWSTGYWPDTSSFFNMVASGQDPGHPRIQQWINQTLNGDPETESIPADRSGDIVAVHVSVGDTVNRDDPLITTSASL